MTTARHRARRVRNELKEKGRSDLARKILPSRDSGFAVKYGADADGLEIIIEVTNDALGFDAVNPECMKCWAPSYLAGPLPGGGIRPFDCVNPENCPSRSAYSWGDKPKNWEGVD